MKKKDRGIKPITVGLFGFGKTGRLVADEFYKDGHFDLKWVVRRTHKDNHKYATRLLGYEVNEARFFRWMKFPPIFPGPSGRHPDRFFQRQSAFPYAPAANYGIRIISAISKYRERTLLI
jgi:4-hydroxy-tetrahydrodipicolinate reductase